jgi:hypothetical protein
LPGVTKPSPQGVAVRSRKRHAFLVDQREWDYGARLPRERRAPETWSTQDGPESTEMPQWGSVADTGSLEPSPEAVVWARRADAWAQQPPAEQAGQWEQPASRWAEVAPTGRQTYPPDGVGWRTETAEWLAAEQTARWRQTTEWRSASGDHGWRSTTEAWQTGGNAEGFRPPATPPTRQQLAISSTAWSTPQSDDPPATGPETPQIYPVPPQSQGTPTSWQPAADGRPAWQQFAAPPPPWQQAAAGGPSWQQPLDTPSAASAPPWQPQGTPPAASAPAWQQPPDPGTPTWRQPQARWQQSLDTPPAASAEPAPRTPDDSPSWQQLIEPTPTRQQPADPTPAWDRADTRPVDRPVSAPSWPAPPSGSTSYASTWSSGLDDGSHLVREDDRAQWRREAATGMAGLGDRASGRRRAPDPDRGSSGTGWATTPDNDDWAGHADTGTMPTFPPPAANSDRPSWRDPAESPSWQREESPSWQRDETRRQREESPSWQPDETRRQRDVPGGRRDQPSWQRDVDTPSWGRGAPSTDWRNESDSWRSEPDSGSWSRGEEPPSNGWRRRSTDAGEDTDASGWPDTAPNTDAWRRDSAPAADPWGQNVADTGHIPMSWEQPATDTGSWRSTAQERPYEAGRRYPDGDEDLVEAPLDPEVWRRDPKPRRDGRNWPAEELRTDWRDQLHAEQHRELPQAGEAVTEIRQRIDPDKWQRGRLEPGAWQREEREQADRGSASYRGGDTGDWRRELAAQSDLSDGEPRRYGTQEFVPFRPSGSASVPASAASPPASPPRAREELLVGNRNGSARWQDPPDTQWPPRGAVTGSYERRAVGALPASSGRSNLLEPDDDEIEENTGGPLAAVGYTIIWYGVPVVLFVLYMLVLNGSQQAHALSTLASAAPQFGLSLVLSMVVAVGLRWASGSWKAASVGLAAAVMGGGLATVLTSAITGNSLS